MPEPAICMFSHDGLDLAYCDEGPRADGPVPVLFLHGWTGDHTVFIPQIRRFTRQRRVVAIDLRGHGRSQGGEPLSVCGLGEDAVRLLDHLEIDAVHIVGHGMGGLVGLDLAAWRGERVTSLMMIDTVLAPAAASPAWIKAASGVLAESALAELIAAVASDLYATDGRALHAPASQDEACRRAFAQVLLRYDGEAAAAAVSAPIAYVASALKLSHAERFASACPHLFEGQILGAHYPAPLHAHEQVTAMIDAFLRMAEADDQAVHANDASQGVI